MHKGHTGSSMGGRQELSPSRAKRRAKARRREEQRWADMAGPVTVRKREDFPTPEDETP